MADPVTLKDLVAGYLDRRLSRRRFVTTMTGWGVSLAAATSILDSLAPLASARASDGERPPATVLDGTGGELLVEQLRAAGVRFVFNCNTTSSAA